MSVLIDGKVSSAQCKKAVHALHQHQAKKTEAEGETELLPGKEQQLWLTVTTKKMQPTKKLMPVKVPLVYPLVDPRTTSICLITKDPQREYKDLLEAQGIKFVSRVVGITKLKGKFKPYEARRMLLQENGLFLADDRVVPLLPSLLGRKWFDAKKQPIPVTLSRKDLKGELERAISSTYMHQNQGTCTAIKFGTMSHTAEQALANLEHALPTIAAKIHGGWENIQSLSIKTNLSTSLPIWNCDLDETTNGRWEGLTINEVEESEDEGDDEMEVDEEAPAPVPEPKKVGKKRAADAETETPKKKAKATPAVVEAVAEKPNKKRKSTAPAETAIVPAPTPIVQAAAADEPSKKKRRKSKAAADADAMVVDEPAPVEVEVESTPSVVETPTLSKAKAKKAARKSKGTTDPNAMDVEEVVVKATAPVATSSAVPTTPTTPKVKLNKRARAKLAAEAAEANGESSTPAVVAEVVVETPAPVVPQPSLKKKKSKGAVSEPAAIVVEAPAAIEVVVESTPTPTLNKKKSKKALAAAAAAAPEADVETPAAIEVVVEATPAPLLKKKKSKKALAAEAAVVEVAAPVEVVPEAAPEPMFNKKKSKKQLVAVAKPVVVEAPPAAVAVEEPKPKKRSRKSDVTAPGTPLAKGVPALPAPSDKSPAKAASITQAEVASKRTGGGDKKKEKTAIKPKGFLQSAKDMLLGKKAAQ